MLIRRIIAFFSVLLSRIMSVPCAPDKETGYLGTAIAPDWFQTTVGPMEINLKSAKSYGWEVYVRDLRSDSLVAGPTFFPTLDLAYDRYCYLHKFYSVRGTQPRRQSMQEAAHNV